MKDLSNIGYKITFPIRMWRKPVQGHGWCLVDADDRQVGYVYCYFNEDKRKAEYIVKLLNEAIELRKAMEEQEQEIEELKGDLSACGHQHGRREEEIAELVALLNRAAPWMDYRPERCVSYEEYSGDYSDVRAAIERFDKKGRHLGKQTAMKLAEEYHQLQTKLDQLVQDEGELIAEGHGDMVDTVIEKPRMEASNRLAEIRQKLESIQLMEEPEWEPTNLKQP